MSAIFLSELNLNCSAGNLIEVRLFLFLFFHFCARRCVVLYLHVEFLFFVRCIPPFRELGRALRCRLAAPRLLSDSTRRMGTVVTNDCSARLRPGVDRICIQSFGSLYNVVGTQGHRPQLRGHQPPSIGAVEWNSGNRPA